MKRNMIFLFILLSLILLQGSKGSSVDDENDQFCQESHQMEELCGPYAHRIVKPMMAYFDQVTQRTDKCNAEMESRNGKINELEKERESSFKDYSIKILEDKNKELLKSLKQQINLLSKINEKQTEEVLECKKDLENNNLKALVTNNSKTFEFLKRQLNQLVNSIENQNKVKETEEIVNNKTRYAKDLNNKNETVLQLQKATKNSEEIDSLNLIEKKDIELKELSMTVEKLTNKLNEIEKEKKSCIARDSSGVHKVKLSNDTTFEVLCNSEIAGPGWTVIQQRINGNVNFQRDWKTYRNGFGDFWDGDFFLGLQKIHRLTIEQPHELYFHMQGFNGSSYYASYDEFAISDEDERYQIIKLGNFSGNTTDEFRYHNNMRFSTFDHDNDGSSGNCASHIHGGWWYNACVLCNMNGKYIESEVKDLRSMQWEDVISLKEVRMMIRPKA